MFIEQSNTSTLNQQWDTVIMFWVSVPVLSEQMHEVDPKVSIDSRFLTRTFFLAILFAVKANYIVTAATTPSGTFATNTPIAIIKLDKASYPQTNPKMKKITASVKAMYETYLMNKFISFDNVEDPDIAEDAKVAICPITVLSPVSNTKPTPDPTVH